MEPYKHTAAEAKVWRSMRLSAGETMFFGALLLLILQFLVGDRLFGWLFASRTFLLLFWAFVYSWHHSRTDAAQR